MIELEIRDIDGIPCAVIKVSGVLDGISAPKLSTEVQTLIPPEFDGHLLLDLRKTEDELTNRHAELVVDCLLHVRGSARTPIAVHTSGAPVRRSHSYFRSAANQEGLRIREFTSMDAALNWLKDPRD